MIGVRAMCFMLVSGFSVSKCVQLSGTRACFFSNFLLFRIMCVRYLTTICEKDSISLWILELRICRFWRSLTVVVCVVPLNNVVIIVGLVPSTLVGIGVGGGWRNYEVFGCCRESILAVSEFKYL